MATPTVRVNVDGSTRPLERKINTLARKGVNLDLNSKNFSAPLGKIKGELGEFDKSLAASNARVLAFGASAGAIFALQRALSETVKATIDVEKQLAEVNVILGASEKTLARFGDELFNIAKQTGRSFAEVALAGQELARQGLNIEETLKRTSDAMILARLSGLGVEASVNAITAALNGFKAAVLDSTAVVDKIIAVDQAFAVSGADLAEALRRVGSTAEGAGVSLNELMGIVTAAQQITARGGSVIGNSFKTIFTRIQRPRVLEALEELGVKTKDVSGASLSAIEILKNLAGTFNTLGDAQKAQIAELVGGVFQINILKAALGDLSSSYSVFAKATDIAANSSGEAARRNSDLNQTLSAGLNETLQNLTKLAAGVGKLTLEPAIRNVLDIVNAITGKINLGETEEKGSSIGQALLAGFGKFLSGPGLALAAVGLFQLFNNLRKFAVDAFRTFTGLNASFQQSQQLQQGILSILQQNPQVLAAIQRGEISVDQAAQQILGSYKGLNAELIQMNNLAATLAQRMAQAGATVGKVKGTSTTSVLPKATATGYIPNFAETHSLSKPTATGHIPNFAETNSLSKPTATGHIPNFAETNSLPKATVKLAQGFVPSFAQDEVAAMALSGMYSKSQISNPKVKKTRIHDGQGGSFMATYNGHEKKREIVGPNGKKGTIIESPEMRRKGIKNYIPTLANIGETAKGFVPNFAAPSMKPIVGTKTAPLLDKAKMDDFLKTARPSDITVLEKSVAYNQIKGNLTKSQQDKIRDIKAGKLPVVNMRNKAGIFTTGIGMSSGSKKGVQVDYTGQEQIRKLTGGVADKQIREVKGVRVIGLGQESVKNVSKKPNLQDSTGFDGLVKREFKQPFNNLARQLAGGGFDGKDIPSPINVLQKASSDTQGWPQFVGRAFEATVNGILQKTPPGGKGTWDYNKTDFTGKTTGQKTLYKAVFGRNALRRLKSTDNVDAKRSGYESAATKNSVAGKIGTTYGPDVVNQIKKSLKAKAKAQGYMPSTVSKEAVTSKMMAATGFIPNFVNKTSTSSSIRNFSINRSQSNSTVAGEGYVPNFLTSSKTNNFSIDKKQTRSIMKSTGDNTQFISKKGNEKVSKNQEEIIVDERNLQKDFAPSFSPRNFISLNTPMAQGHVPNFYNNFSGEITASSLSSSLPKSEGYIPNFSKNPPTVGFGKSKLEREQQRKAGKPIITPMGKTLKVGTLQGGEDVKIFLKELKTQKYNKVDVGHVTGQGTVTGLMTDKMMQRLRDNGVKRIVGTIDPRLGNKPKKDTPIIGQEHDISRKFNDPTWRKTWGISKDSTKINKTLAQGFIPSFTHAPQDSSTAKGTGYIPNFNIQVEPRKSTALKAKSGGYVPNFYNNFNRAITHNRVSTSSSNLSYGQGYVPNFIQKESTFSDSALAAKGYVPNFDKQKGYGSEVSERKLKTQKIFKELGITKTRKEEKNILLNETSNEKARGYIPNFTISRPTTSLKTKAAGHVPNFYNQVNKVINNSKLLSRSNTSSFTEKVSSNISPLTKEVSSDVSFVEKQEVIKKESSPKTIGEKFKKAQGSKSNSIINILSDTKLAATGHIPNFYSRDVNHFHSNNNADGFVPNFFDDFRKALTMTSEALGESITREKKGMPKGAKIEVGRDKKFITKKNPFGLATTNTVNEPNGIKDVLAQGHIPKVRAQGHVPNFFFPASAEKTVDPKKATKNLPLPPPVDPRVPKPWHVSKASGATQGPAGPSKESSQKATAGLNKLGTNAGMAGDASSKLFGVMMLANLATSTFAASAEDSTDGMKSFTNGLNAGVQGLSALAMGTMMFGTSALGILTSATIGLGVAMMSYKSNVDFASQAMKDNLTALDETSISLTEQQNALQAAQQSLSKLQAALEGTDAAALRDAQKNYADTLKKLTPELQRQIAGQTMSDQMSTLGGAAADVADKKQKTEEAKNDQQKILKEIQKNAKSREQKKIITLMASILGVLGVIKGIQVVQKMLQVKQNAVEITGMAQEQAEMVREAGSDAVMVAAQNATTAAVIGAGAVETAAGVGGEVVGGVASGAAAGATVSAATTSAAAGGTGAGIMATIKGALGVAAKGAAIFAAKIGLVIVGIGALVQGVSLFAGELATISGGVGEFFANLSKATDLLGKWSEFRESREGLDEAKDMMTNKYNKSFTGAGSGFWDNVSWKDAPIVSLFTGGGMGKFGTNQDDGSLGMIDAEGRKQMTEDAGNLIERIDPSKLTGQNLMELQRAGGQGEDALIAALEKLGVAAEEAEVYVRGAGEMSRGLAIEMTNLVRKQKEEEAAIARIKAATDARIATERALADVMKGVISKNNDFISAMRVMGNAMQTAAKDNIKNSREFHSAILRGGADLAKQFMTPFQNTKLEGDIAKLEIGEKHRVQSEKIREKGNKKVFDAITKQKDVAELIKKVQKGGTDVTRGDMNFVAMLETALRTGTAGQGAAGAAVGIQQALAAAQSKGGPLDKVPKIEIPGLLTILAEQSAEMAQAERTRQHQLRVQTLQTRLAQMQNKINQQNKAGGGIRAFLDSKSLDKMEDKFNTAVDDFTTARNRGDTVKTGQAAGNLLSNLNEFVGADLMGPAADKLKDMVEGGLAQSLKGRAMARADVLDQAAAETGDQSLSQLADTLRNQDFGAIAATQVASEFKRQKMPDNIQAMLDVQGRLEALQQTDLVANQQTATNTSRLADHMTGGKFSQELQNMVRGLPAPQVRGLGQVSAAIGTAVTAMQETQRIIAEAATTQQQTTAVRDLGKQRQEKEIQLQSMMETAREDGVVTLEESQAIQKLIGQINQISQKEEDIVFGRFDPSTGRRTGGMSQEARDRMDPATLNEIRMRGRAAEYTQTQGFGNLRAPEMQALGPLMAQAIRDLKEALDRESTADRGTGEITDEERQAGRRIAHSRRTSILGQISRGEMTRDQGIAMAQQRVAEFSHMAQTASDPEQREKFLVAFEGMKEFLERLQDRNRGIDQFGDREDFNQRLMDRLDDMAVNNIINITIPKEMSLTGRQEIITIKKRLDRLAENAGAQNVGAP